MNEIDKKATDLTVASIRKDLLKSLYEYNEYRENVKEFTLDYEVVNGYVFTIAYLITTNETFSHLYRMDVRSIYGVDIIYKSGNATCVKSYTVEDVKKQCKAYFNSYANEFKNL